MSEKLPFKVTLGKLVFGGAGEVEITPIKVKTVYENGKFVGPSIAEEEKLDY